jgi:hypothetical protein
LARATASLPLASLYQYALTAPLADYNTTPALSGAWPGGTIVRLQKDRMCDNGYDSEGCAAHTGELRASP